MTDLGDKRIEMLHGQRKRADISGKGRTPHGQRKRAGTRPQAPSLGAWETMKRSGRQLKRSGRQMKGSGRQASREPDHKHPAWETNEKKWETSEKKWETNERKWETSQPGTRPLPLSWLVKMP